MMKLIALGNVLMEDDGIAIYLAKEIEKELLEMGIEIIYGETDIGYCISSISEKDYLIVLDAAGFEIPLGEVRRTSLKELHYDSREFLHHSISFMQLYSLYFPKAEGDVFAVGIGEVSQCLGLSNQLNNMRKELSSGLLEQIKEIKNKRLLNNLGDKVGVNVG